MPETAKERNRRWLPVIISCALLIGTAMWASVFIPQGSARATVPEVTEAAFPQTLCIRDGRLLRLSADGVLLERYDVAVLSLPVEEQQRLAQGIRIGSEEELAGMLENYLS